MVSTPPVRSRAADFAAVAVILLAAALSTAWAFIVPIFQAPDEPAHFDYAISIYSAGRLIRVSDGRVDWIVSPYTKYLLEATKFDRIVRHSSFHVPTDYGTAAYFARIDKYAPSLHARIPSGPRINYIVPLYPFGFYALEAVWMHAVSLVTNSLVAVFFAARLLCVFLTMIGLYFNYRTALELGIGRWMSVAIIAAIGLLPLTSFVSSSIQPDNLSYALVSVALFFATRLRRRPPSAALVGALGLALGLLAITKYQFFLSVAIPGSLLLAARLVQAKLGAARTLALALFFLAPATVLFAVQAAIIDHSAAPMGSNVVAHIPAGRMEIATALGIQGALLYAMAGIGSAYMDCFISGICAATFWQPGGWADTAIILFNPIVEVSIRAVISAITVATTIILAFFLIKRFLQLAVAAARGHAKLALRIMSANPVINSYLCFIAIMFGLYVVTNNGYGASGRHWYPYVFAAFLCVVWYAPRALLKRRFAGGGALVAALLAYSVAASGYALGDIRHRYYGPETTQYASLALRPAQIVPGTARGVLWPVQPISYWMDAANRVFTFSVGSRLRATGAAIPSLRPQTRAVSVLLDGTVPLPVLSGQYLSGIAEALHSPADGYSGFTADIPTNLPEGPHMLVAFAKGSEAEQYRQLMPQRLFFLTPRGDRFSNRFLRSLAGSSVVPATRLTMAVCNGNALVRGSTWNVERGGVLLLTGTIVQRNAPAYSAAWFVVDGRPLPARYNGGAFAGTIPTGRLPLGRYHVAIYTSALEFNRIGKASVGADFNVELPHQNANEFLRDPPPACADPFREMAPS